MKLPNISSECKKAVIGKAEQDNPYLYGAKYMINLLKEDRKGLVSMITTASEIVFPESLTGQARATAVTMIVLGAINASLEGKDLDEQFKG